MLMRRMSALLIWDVISGVKTLILERPENIYEYYENPHKYYEIRDRMIDKMERRMKIFLPCMMPLVFQRTLFLTRLRIFGKMSQMSAIRIVLSVKRRALKLVSKM